MTSITEVLSVLLFAFCFPESCIYYFFIQVYICILNQRYLISVVLNICNGNNVYIFVYLLCHSTLCFLDSSISLSVDTFIHFYCYTPVHYMNMEPFIHSVDEQLSCPAFFYYKQYYYKHSFHIS